MALTPQHEEMIRKEMAEVSGLVPPQPEPSGWAEAQRVEQLSCRIADLEVQVHALRGRVQDLEHGRAG